MGSLLRGCTIGQSRLGVKGIKRYLIIRWCAPVALGIGVGSDSRQPLAVAIAGGMISSTFLTLGVVPVAYSCLINSRAGVW